MRGNMKSFYFILFISVFFSEFYAQENFFRVDSIPVPVVENTGFGSFISGVDFDGDGRSEIYAVNNMMDLGGAELIPRLYKFEYNGFSWDSVWAVEMVNITAQNSWAPLTYGDWDTDGKMEIIWGPINNFDAGSNPPRILVFEYPGDGSDKMGVEIFGGFSPNAQWTITNMDNFNLRPIKWELNDIDSDGTQELIFADRAGTYFYGVVSVSDIPDNASGTETWSLESSGEGSGINLSTIYDMFIVDSTIYLVHNDNSITPVSYSGGTYTILGSVPNAIPGASWKSAQVADIDNDGTQEVVVGGWGTGNNKVFLLQASSSGITTTQIANALPLISATGRLNGGANGDIDLDGKLDFVFGTRQSVPKGSILRLSYKGGSITDSASYELTRIDSLYPSANISTRYDVVNISNIDSDPTMEVLYTDGNTYYGRTPIIILDANFASFAHDENLLQDFYLAQNFPNPFNPTTNITFGLTREMVVDLRVYNILGQEIAVLIDNDILSGGTYSISFSGENLSSGIYICELKAEGHTLSNKMLLIK
jgi:hypothetical protein